MQNQEWTRLTAITVSAANAIIVVNVKGRRHSIQIGRPNDDGSVDRYMNFHKMDEVDVIDSIGDGLEAAFKAVREHEKKYDEERAARVAAQPAVERRVRKGQPAGLSKLAEKDAAAKGDEALSNFHKKKEEAPKKPRNDRSALDQQIRSKMKGATGGGGGKKGKK